MFERRFDITSKHDNQWLLANRNGGYKLDSTVASDIYHNARELDGRVDWGEILQGVNCKHGKNEYDGVPALTFSIAKTVGFGVMRIGWGMSSPEVVYMSGSYFVRNLGGNIGFWADRIEKIEDGRVILEDNEKEETVKEAQRTISRLATFRARLNGSVSEYVNQYLPQATAQHLEVIKALPTLNPRKMGLKPSERYKVLDSIRSGDIATAHRIVVAHQPQPTASS